MKKTFNKLVFIMLAFILSVGAVGCFGGKVSDDEQTLQIYCDDSGYGVDWCDAMIEAFKEQDWVKQKYPELKIPKPTYNDITTYVSDRISTNATKNTYDLMFAAHMYSYSGSQYLLDLTEVIYNAKVPGENVLYKDKMDSSYLQSLTYLDKKTQKEKWYMTPWAAGMEGFCYNQKILDAYGLAVPNTTKELSDACATIKATPSKSGNEAGYSIIQSKDAIYWDYMFETFWAQYDGIKTVDDFWNGKYYDEELDGYILSNKIFNHEGRLKSLEVYADILDYDKAYVSSNSFTDEFMAAQTSFLDGKYAFHVNGDWFDNEMYEIGQAIINEGGDISGIKMMKTPIVSSIIDRRECKTIENDAELSALITAIDNGSTALEGDGYSVSQAAYDKIKEARSIVFSIGANLDAIIPSYAKGKDVAVDFLRFMATDLGLETYLEATYGASLPFDYDVKEENIELYNKLSTFQQGRLDYFNTYEIFTLPNPDKYPLKKFGGLWYLASTTQSPYTIFSTAGCPDDKAELMFDETKNLWNANRFTLALESAGLTVQ
jgi:ABC-type glycerol-3-phosphate transport system substrate-binding protein